VSEASHPRCSKALERRLLRNLKVGAGSVADS
jgi:hypothetical protein